MCVYMHIYAEISPPAVRKVILVSTCLRSLATPELFQACDGKSSILLFYRKIIFSRAISRTSHHVAQTLFFSGKKKKQKKFYRHSDRMPVELFNRILGAESALYIITNPVGYIPLITPAHIVGKGFTIGNITAYDSRCYT